MEKFIPYEKLSKKEKRKLNQARRQTWGELNPVTRKPENSKAYNRNKAQNWKRDYHENNSGFFIMLFLQEAKALHIVLHSLHRFNAFIHLFTALRPNHKISGQIFLDFIC